MRFASASSAGAEGVELETMGYKTAEEIFQPDARFAAFVVMEERGLRPVTILDHHASIGRVILKGAAPIEVVDAYERARNTMLYAFFDYDLLVVGEIQAYGAFELALKHRINGHGGDAKGSMRKLVDQARKAGIFPKLEADAGPFDDPVEAIVALRNSLAHGNSQIHAPGMALQVLDSCAWGIDTVFPATGAPCP
jgi:hypothetical protein